MISSFKGKYFFLSNFYLIDVLYDGILYPSSEHAYMSGKTDDIEIKRYISTLPTPALAKKYSSGKVNNNFELVSDWDLKKDMHMYNVLKIKFQDDKLKQMLDDTGDAELIEGNTHGDKYWGQCPLGVGKNMLGVTLMRIRNENRMWE